MKIVDLSLDQSFKFQAGQFISIEMTDHRRGTKTFRSYSIASCPCNNGLQLCVSCSDNLESVGHTYFRNLKEGDEIIFRGPFGKFIFEPIEDEAAVFIAGGSGIAPLRSMILRATEGLGLEKPITLYYSARQEEDFCYREEFEKLAQKMPNFRYYLGVSADDAEVSEQYYSGDVITVFKKHPPLLENTDFYLCGSPPMIEAVKEMLSGMGVEETRVNTEAY